MRVGPHVLKPESVNWLRRELWQGDLSRSALARGLSGQDGWHNPQRQLCAAPARKALPGLASKLGLELPPARARAATAGGHPQPVVMLARKVAWRPLKRGPVPGIKALWRAFEQVRAIRRLL